MSTARLSSTCIVLAAFSLAVLAGPGNGPAKAEKFVARPVSHVSKDSLKKSCASEGGEYAEFGEDYWCQKGNNTVACNKQKCTGVSSAGALSPTRPLTSLPDLHRFKSLPEDVK